MSPSGDLIDAAASPGETLRLLAELEAAWTAMGISWAREASDGAREQLRTGELNGVLWVGPRDEAVGLATWDAGSEIGRRVSLFLSEGFRSTAAFGAFVERIAADGEACGAPVIGWFDMVPGIPREAQATVLEPRGAFHVTRIDLRYPLVKPLFEAPGPTPAGLRGLTVDDEASVARLLQIAYADNPVEQAVFIRDRDPVREAERSARDLLHERYGRWMSEASFGVFEGGELGAAVLVNDLNGPLITEVMTAPLYRRRGWATHLLHASLHAMRARGSPEPRLVVTTWNERAHRLYRRLGFEHVPGADGGIWLDLARMGLKRPDGPQGQ
jgi:ribosomal protein S18 acetylase RimI-like enzyme